MEPTVPRALRRVGVRACTGLSGHLASGPLAGCERVAARVILGASPVIRSKAQPKTAAPRHAAHQRPLTCRRPPHRPVSHPRCRRCSSRSSRPSPPPRPVSRAAKPAIRDPDPTSFVASRRGVQADRRHVRCRRPTESPSGLPAAVAIAPSPSPLGPSHCWPSRRARSPQRLRRSRPRAAPRPSARIRSRLRPSTSDC